MKGEIVLSQREIQRGRVMEQVMQGVLSAVDAGGLPWFKLSAGKSAEGSLPGGRSSRAYAWQPREVTGKYP